jgi:uncharacterized protein YecE (DUF72 family)
MTKPGRIRVGIGGWTYDPWRETFYPPEVPKARELEYASRRLTAIEINSTYYGTQKPASFAKWRDQTPDGFVFSVKATRFATNRKVLADAGESVDRFVNSGLAELGDKLGPLLWQFMPTKKFDAVDMEGFMQLLPAKLEGRPLRHVLDVRHASFMCEEFLALARRHGVATVFTDSPDHPSFADATADFAYARLMCSRPEIETGYSFQELDAWAARVSAWAQGKAVGDLPLAGQAGKKNAPRDVYVFIISGAKERAPAAATALLQRVGQKT